MKVIRHFLLVLMTAILPAAATASDCAQCREDCRTQNEARKRINSAPPISRGVSLKDCALACGQACSEDATVESGIKLLPASYGVTLYLNDNGPVRKEFRTVAAAKAFIAKLSEPSVFLAVFYGHGSPGAMAVGKEHVDGPAVVSLLAGKMAPGFKPAVHLVGCNTAEVDLKVSINPASGLAYLARRLVYYDGLRVSGISRDTANEAWDLSMARDVSSGLPGVRVCGLSTFGLVPGRLIGKETIEPGLVIGHRLCFVDGKAQ